MRRSLPIAVLGLAALLLAACESTSSTTMPAEAEASMGILNDSCPVMGQPVDPGAGTVEYAGHSIGFCCAGCTGKWAEMSEADKAAFVSKYTTAR